MQSVCLSSACPQQCIFLEARHNRPGIISGTHRLCCLPVRSAVDSVPGAILYMLTQPAPIQAAPSRRQSSAVMHSLSATSHPVQTARTPQAHRGSAHTPNGMPNPTASSSHHRASLSTTRRDSSARTKERLQPTSAESSVSAPPPHVRSPTPVSRESSPPNGTASYPMIATYHISRLPGADAIGTVSCPCSKLICHSPS